MILICEHEIVEMHVRGQDENCEVGGAGHFRGDDGGFVFGAEVSAAAGRVGGYDCGSGIGAVVILPDG